MFQSFPRRSVPAADGQSLSEKLHRPKRTIALAALFWLTLVAIAGVSSSAVAQTAEFSQGNKTANVVSLEVPLGSYPGDGINLPITLHYSSTGLWRIGFLNTAYANVNGFSYRRSVTEAIYAEHSTAGWTTTLNVPQIEWPKLTDRYKWSGEPTVDYLAGYTYRIARVWIHMPDGSTHELRKSDQVYVDNGVINMSGDFYAVDGSRMRYNSTGATTGTLYLADGTRYILNGGTTQYIDRNGNTLNYDGSQWTDTMGRHFNMPWPANPSVGDYTYSLPGINGSAITYVLKFRTLSTVFIPDVANQTQKPVADYVNGLPPQPVGTSGLFNSGYTGTLDETDPGYERTFTYVVDGGGFGATTFDPVVLAEIDLPNGQNYKFYYNAYGELDKVTYPTGGYQRYQYGGVATIGISSFPYGLGSRGMLSRWISPSGSGSDEAQWTYSSGNNPLSVTAPNGTRSDTYLFWPQTYWTNQFGYQDGRMGLPVETRIYAAQSQGGAMLRRTLIDYDQSSQTYSRPSPGSGTYTAYRNQRPIKTVSLILDTGGNALASTTTTGYDTTYDFTVGSDATTSSQYDFASVDQTTAQTGAINSIPIGSLVRSTQTAYLTSDANYRNRNILGLPTSATIYDAASSVVAQGNISYDESSFPLLTYGSVTSWTDPGTNVRGNATSHASWLNTTNSFPQTHAQYDQCGSARNVWDAKGNQSQVEYSSTYAYAYPTLARTAVPDPSGQYGSSTAFQSTSIFDFNTGLATLATDANGFTSIPEYNDALMRPTRAVHASGTSAQTQSLMEYDDANRIVTGKSDLNNFTDSTLKATTLTDAMGRTIETRTYESATNYIAVQTQYDSMGRAYKVSNPFRPLAPYYETPVWTTSGFDALGRVISVTTPEGAVVTTSYSGNTVTVTDQAGRKRRSVSDAVGRVIRVDEPDANGNLDDQNGNPVQSTNYLYDTLGNLRQVTQGSQQRFFMYDSLSRLIRAKNPEQDVNSSLNLTDSITGNSSWSVGYVYDSNGNLTQKTDARGLVSTYAYDALNRNTTVTYTNDPANTSTVTRTYDGATNGLGRLWKTQTSGDSGSLTTIDSYDALGRPLTQRQQFFAYGYWSQSYTVSASYDKAGHMLTETYPSGHIVTYHYDQAGRLADNAQGSAFTGNLGLGGTRTYASGILYDNASRWTREQFGTTTPIYNKRHYNIRGQLYDMRASTASDDVSWNRGAILNYYNFQNFGVGTSGSDNNGNLLIQQHWVPNDDQITSYTVHQQNYDYDSLNRLRWMDEYLNAQVPGTGGQSYTYDRYGNRSASGIFTQPFSVDANTNRLGVPSGQPGTMAYDSAGNLTTDTYSGSGTRTYDAENRMITATAGDNTNEYTYDGNGRRVRRYVATHDEETWQVYGFGGELLAEYDAEDNWPSDPTKEYGYRNGELLVVAEVYTPPPPPPICYPDGEGGEICYPFDGGPPQLRLHWLLTDQLGTPRIIFDQSGSLSGASRHDYLPFGEELYAGISGRTTQQGYSASDGVRQHFTGYEADGETGLNFAQARYHSPVQGRFTGVDPLMTSATIADPQSFNRYSYVQNNPLNSVDPTGMSLADMGVLQTSDPYEAQSAQDLSLRRFQMSINDDYAARNGGNVSYSGRHATFDRLPNGSVVATVNIYRNFETWSGQPNIGAMINALNGLHGMHFGPASNGFNFDSRGVSDASRAFTFAGFAGTAEQYYYVNDAGTMWRGLDGVMHPVTGYHPNGATGARALAFEKAGAFRALGRVAGIIGIGISSYHAYSAFNQGNDEEGRQSTADAIMGGVGFAGYPGAIASGTYFTVELTGGFNPPYKREMGVPRALYGKPWW